MRLNCGVSKIDFPQVLESIKQFFIAYAHSSAVLLAFVAVFVLLERLLLAEREQSWRDIWFNLKYFALAQVISLFLTPIVFALLLAPLQTKWPQLFGWVSSAKMASVAWFTFLYYFVFDFFYYWFHRFQHRFSLLWREHLLHHSETALNATTTLRQHWLEEPLKVLFMSLPLAIIFAEQPKLAGVLLLVLQSWAIFIHSNLRLPLGWLGLIVTGPQFHRIHHSRLLEHQDRNFAVFFPLLDYIFGTYHHPTKNEFPPTGLNNNRILHTQVEAHLAPFLPLQKPNATDESHGP